MKKVSVITINYNNAEGLEKTMQSVLGQVDADMEYLVIDGGSTDGSKAVIEKYRDRLAYWVSEKDSGIYNAMNKGILKASGDYCLFLNSGDYLHDPHVLSSVFAQAPGAAILYGNMLIDWGGGRLEAGKMPARISFEHMYLDTLWHPVSFIKRELFGRYGLYNETYKIVSDYDFFFQVIVMRSVSLHYVDRLISVYSVDGISSRPENKALEKAERRSVIQSYLPPAVIEFAERHCAARPLRASVFTKLKRLFN